MTQVVDGQTVMTLPARVAWSAGRIQKRAHRVITWPIVFALACVLLVGRIPDVLLNARFIYEDGPQFYLGSFLYDPLESLFRPYAGFLYVAGRIVALLSRLAPVAGAPFVASVASVFITAAVATYVATRLRADPAIRLALGALVLVVPGVIEGHGQMTWLGWYLAPFLAVVPLSRRPSTEWDAGARLPQS